MKNLTSTAGLNRYLKSQREWLISFQDDTFPVFSEEISVQKGRDALVVEFIATRGLVRCAFTELKIVRETVLLDGPNGVLTLIPRTSAREFRLSVEDSRTEEANRLAERLSRQFRTFRPLRTALNETNGRFAEISARYRMGEVVALADVTGIVQPESLFVRAFSWLSSLEQRKKNQVREVWVIVDEDRISSAEALAACLLATAREKLRILGYKKQANEGEHFVEVSVRPLDAFWYQLNKRNPFEIKKENSTTSDEIRERYQESIDVISNKVGETVRFHGLPFMRIRQLKSEERVWFGIENPRQLLSSENTDEFKRLLETLKLYRNSDSPNKQHESYRLAPEAWLESLLRRDIKILDRNLLLSPIYNQFRTVKEKIDLLALREDGRLVIIELKVNEDREMVFQAADYWRKIEQFRRDGSLNEAEIFGSRRIANQPALIYLVAPALSFHAETDKFINMLDPRIEVCRFEIAENWRSKIVVTRRIQ